MHRLSTALFALTMALAIAACGESRSDPFTMLVGPEFVNGAVPGGTMSLLVAFEQEHDSDDPVHLSASAAGAVVVVEPSAIVAGEVAEVRITPQPVATGDTVISVAVRATRGDVIETVSRDVTVFDWEDDRGPQARALLDVFLEWLATNRPDLGLGPETLTEGSMVAPGLLVVSHYCFVTDDWEIGLSWHIMIPPDDWAEIYLRPRGAWSPTEAFRLSSQRAALEDGLVEIAEVAPPTEIAR